MAILSPLTLPEECGIYPSFLCCRPCPPFSKERIPPASPYSSAGLSILFYIYFCCNSSFEIMNPLKRQSFSHFLQKNAESFPSLRLFYEFFCYIIGNPWLLLCALESWRPGAARGASWRKADANQKGAVHFFQSLFAEGSNLFFQACFIQRPDLFQ